MSTENIITIFTTLAFGPGVAVVLLRWVLGRASAQDVLLANQSSRLEAQAGQISKLQTKVEELEGEGREALAKRIADSVAEESKLIVAIDQISRQATRLAAAVDSLNQAMSLRTCQLPSAVLSKVRDWMEGHYQGGAS